MRTFQAVFWLPAVAALALTGAIGCGSSEPSSGDGPVEMTPPSGGEGQEAQEAPLEPGAAATPQDAHEAATKRAKSKSPHVKKPPRPAWCNGKTVDGGCTFLH